MIYALVSSGTWPAKVCGVVFHFGFQRPKRHLCEVEKKEEITQWNQMLLSIVHQAHFIALFGGFEEFCCSCEVACEARFSNSLIFHQVRTKEITTLKEVWIPRIFMILLLRLLLSLCFDWEDISNTRDSVSSAIQTPRISSNILRYASYFQLYSRCLDIPTKHCLSCLIFLQTLRSGFKALYYRKAR